MTKKLEIDTLWYFPSNRWIFRNTKSKISSPIYIPIENKSSNIKRRIIVNPGENILQENEYKHILEHSSMSTLKPYFDEGSFVWGKDRKINSFTSIKTEETSDIEAILLEVSNSSTIEELESILNKSKNNTVMLAVKERFNEINKSNSKNITELN
jgi:hypothetical protein